MTTPLNVLEGKIAIVTGAASPIGMGRSITTGLVRAGARVVMLDINQDWLDQTANDLRELGGDNAVLPIIADVTDPESVESAVARTIGEMGRPAHPGEQRRHQSPHRRLHFPRGIRQQHRILGHRPQRLASSH